MELPKLVNFNPYNKEKLPRLVLDVWGEGTFDYGSNPWGYIEDPELVEAVEQAIESGEYVKYTQEGRSSYIKKGETLHKLRYGPALVEDDRHASKVFVNAYFAPCTAWN